MLINKYDVIFCGSGGIEQYQNLVVVVEDQTQYLLKTLSKLEVIECYL